MVVFIFYFLRNPILFSIYHFTFIQRRLTNSQLIYEKMFNNITYQKNAYQIKITMRYHLIPIRMTIIKETKKLTDVDKDRQRLKSFYTPSFISSVLDLKICTLDFSYLLTDHYFFLYSSLLLTM